MLDTEPTRGLAGVSPDVPGDADVRANSSAALERFVKPEKVPFLRGVFFSAGGFWLASVNLRILSRTELVRLSCSNVKSFFSGAAKKETDLREQH